MKSGAVRGKTAKRLQDVLLWLRRLFVAARSVTVDLSSLQEFVVWTRGGQDLSANNRRFYANFLLGTLLPVGRRFHFIDVGANDGWFARTILRYAPNSRITSYEPLISQHAHLQSLAERYASFQFRPKAVGDQTGSLPITEYGTSGLSSLKELNNSYKYSDHYSQAVLAQYAVELVRLDDELHDILSGQQGDELVLKIDTQGFELEVLKGAATCLRHGLFRYIIIELMTVEKYKGAHLYDEIFAFLHGHGYRLWDINTTYYEPGSRRLSEFDAIFERRGETRNAT